AAHQTEDAANQTEGYKQGPRPLRNLEVWEAIRPALSQDTYDELLKDPEKAAEKFVEDGVEKLRSALSPGAPVSQQEKFDEIKTKGETAFIENFKVDAKKFLIEFAKQLPKGSMGRQGADGGTSPLELSGVGRDKFMNSMACKAGLWFAKEENKPI